MATESNSAGDKLVVHLDGVRHELIVRVRYGEPQISGEALSSIAAATVGAWLRAWRAIHDDTWNVGVVESPEKKYLTEGQYEQRKEQRKYGAEPYATVFNKTFDGLSLTVHSHDNGQQAVTAAAAFVTMKEALAEKMPQLFQAPQNAPKKAVERDINDVDSFLQDSTPKATQKAGNVYVRPAMEGSIAGTIKLEKGAKDKLTWETAILANQPYSFNAVQYKEKDLVAYPILGAISYTADSSGFYFNIPTDNANIRIKVKDATLWNGKTIESDSQKLAQHLGLKGIELSQGMSWDVPATHVAMKIGKTNEKDEQFKNYAGLYELK